MNGDLWKAILTVAVYAAIGFWMWAQYPRCMPGYIAVFAPQTMTLWACAQGYYIPTEAN